MVRRRRQRGYSLMEVMVAMTIFGMFLAVFFILTAEMRGWEKRLPVNMHKHPQVIAVLARLRRDVLDATDKSPYDNEHDGYVASEKVLIIESLQPNGEVHTVIWDFRVAGEVRRRAYDVGVAREWVARGLPAEFGSVEIEPLRVSASAAWATRILARDENGNIAIDQILQPRATD